MFRLNDELYNNCSVSVENASSELIKKMIYQLSPFIVYENGDSENKIVLQKSDINSTQLFKNVLLINYSNDLYVTMALRQSIREILYRSYLDSFIKMHCSAVEKNDRVFVFMGKNCTGKTSTALGLCKYCDYSLINGDLSLVSGKQLLGWSTSIGTRDCTNRILNIPEDQNSKDNGLNWLWQEDYKKLGYSFASKGIIEKIVFVDYEFNSGGVEFDKISKQEKLKLLNANIHYDEINKNTYWGVKQSISGESINEKNDIMNVDAFRFISNGLSEKNIKILSMHLEDKK